MLRLLATLLALALLGAKASADPASVRIARSFVLDVPAAPAPDAPDFAALAAAPAREVASVDDLKLSLDRPTWFRLELTRERDDGQRRWLRLRAATQREVHAYLVVDGRLIEQTVAGIRHPDALEGFTAVDATLPLERWQGAEAAVYFRCHPAQSLALAPAIHLEHELWAVTRSSLFVNAVYFGAVFFLLLFRTALFLSFRDTASRDYMLFAGMVMVAAAGRTGYFDHALGGWLAPVHLGEYGAYFKSFNTILGLRCFESIFELRTNLPALSRANRLLQAVAAVEILAAFFLSDTTFEGLASATQIGATLLGLLTCFAAVRHQLPAAALVLVGWLGIFGASAYLSLTALSVLPKSPAIPYVAIAGVVWEMVFNTLALTHRFRLVGARRHEAELRELEVSSLRRMVRILCHDVSAPTAVVRVSAELLKRAWQERRAVDLGSMSDHLANAANSLTGIINSVRQLERLQTQGSRLEVAPTHLGQALSEAVELLREQLAAKNLRLAGPSGAPDAWVLADAPLLRSTVLTNALTNAIKFSQPGGTIETSITRGDDGRTVRLELRDQGIGMPAALRREFQISGRVESRAGTQGETGSGFGVQLMHEFTLAMGGTLEIDSATAEEAPGRSGTTVRITLQAAPTPPAAA